MDRFDIPIVLFIFKREKVLEIINQLRIIKPQKIYIIADNGRNEEEKKKVLECRMLVEQSIDWECELIKNYADENRGVWGNIALGAEWVFNHEEKAIFLEDDNYPAISFFEYCKELLEKYKDEDKVLWICGTNYLGKYQPKDGSSYMFTRHLLPCGWASWSNKFLKYYDKEMNGIADERKMKQAKKNFHSYYLFKQYKRSWVAERNALLYGKRPVSWDYQMDFAIKSNSLFGISPCVNQIKNIGVDDDSIHGGNSINQIMTKRFCGIPEYEMSFPLIHPSAIDIDMDYESRIAKILAYPIRVRINNLFIKIKRRLNGKGNAKK